MGDGFTVADAYLFTVTNWADKVKFDLAPFPNVRAFQIAPGSGCSRGPIIAPETEGRG